MESWRGTRWAARGMWGIAVLFMALDVAGKLAAPAPVVEGTARLGYPVESVAAIGWIELVCLALYVIPRTAMLGAVLLTGYLGGAVATHFRIGDPLFSHTLFPIYVATLFWGALFLRDPRLRALLPLRRPPVHASPRVLITEESTR